MYRELVLNGVATFAEGDSVHTFRRDPNPVRPRPLYVPSVDVIRKTLGGRDLVCWCALDVPCHADVLLDIANNPETHQDGDTTP